MLQSFCALNKLKKRNDVREMIRAVDKTHSFDITCSDELRKRAENTGANDVSEVYSPPRVMAMADKMGLKTG